MKLLQDTLERACRLYGDRCCVLASDVQFTYRQTADRVRRLAAGLLGLGLAPGEHLGVLMNNGYPYFECYFAAALAGLPIVPLNQRLTARELDFIIWDAAVRGLILGADQLALWKELEAAIPAERVVVVGAPGSGRTDYESLVRGSPLERSPREWREGEMVLLSYTGGTTGRPKGVMLSHRNLLASATNAIVAYGLVERDRYFHAAPMFHSADFWANGAITLLGATHVFGPTSSPPALLETIAKHRVTTTLMVPTTVNFLVSSPRLASFDLGSLERLVCGGSFLAPDLLKAANRALGPKLIPAYGMTECATLMTSMPLGLPAFDGSELDERRLASCGREAIHTAIRVVEPHGERELPPGEVGEVVARGPNVMLGYWNREEETRQAFLGDFLRTGDLGRLDDDGFLFLVDRVKDVIVAAGENVYSAEVESAIHTHPAVLEAAVFGIPDPEWGELVCAVVVPKEGHPLAAKDIVAHCQGLIAAFKCPQKVILQSEPLPKSGPGKILKSELRKPFWKGFTRRVN